jgi:hypothetical protein
MPLEWSNDSFFKKESRKWDTPKRDGGYRCDGYEPYPKMLYKAQRNPMTNQYVVAIAEDYLSLDKTTVLLGVEAFNATCQKTVNDQREEERAYADGWRDHPQKAMDYHTGVEKEKAVEHAVRNYTDRNMGEKAKAEIAAVESKSTQHVPEIPEKPKRKYTRKAKPAQQEA